MEISNPTVLSLNDAFMALKTSEGEQGPSLKLNINDLEKVFGCNGQELQNKIIKTGSVNTANLLLTNGYPIEHNPYEEICLIRETMSGNLPRTQNKFSHSRSFIT